MVKDIPEYYHRRLPHYQPEKATYFITMRLHDSIPQSVLVELLRLRSDDTNKKNSFNIMNDKYFGHFDKWLDKCTDGPLWLSDHRVASHIQQALHNLDSKDTSLICYCIMPNHLHLILELLHKSNLQTEVRATYQQYPLTKILRLFKGSTAREANIILNRTGSFWQHESYDHVIRNESELENIIWYILNNPVIASLCKTWQDWKWNYINKEYL